MVGREGEVSKLKVWVTREQVRVSVVVVDRSWERSFQTRGQGDSSSLCGHGHLRRTGEHWLHWSEGKDLLKEYFTKYFTLRDYREIKDFLQNQVFNLEPPFSLPMFFLLWLEPEKGTSSPRGVYVVNSVNDRSPFGDPDIIGNLCKRIYITLVLSEKESVRNWIWNVSRPFLHCGTSRTFSNLKRDPWFPRQKQKIKKSPMDIVIL